MTKKIAALVLTVAFAASALGATLYLSNIIDTTGNVTGLNAYWNTDANPSTQCDRIIDGAGAGDEILEMGQFYLGEQVCFTAHVHDNTGGAISSYDAKFNLTFDGAVPEPENFTLEYWDGSAYVGLTWDPATGEGVIRAGVGGSLDFPLRGTWWNNVVDDVSIQVYAAEPGT